LFHSTKHILIPPKSILQIILVYLVTGWKP
jgi:hypothetical protein